MKLIKRFFFTTGFLLIVPVWLSCSGKYEYSEFERLIGSVNAGDFSAILPLDNTKLRRLQKTDEASVFCIGIHFAQAGFLEEAKTAFKFGIENCKEPFNLACEKQIYNLYSPKEKLSFLQHKLNEKEKLLKDFTGSANGKNEEILMEIFTLKEEIQKLLFSSGRFNELEKNLPALYASSAITEDSYKVYLNIQPQKKAYFPDFYKTMEMRLLVFEKRFDEAWQLAEILFSSDSSYILSRNILSDMGRAALYGSKNHAETAAVFETQFLKCEEKENDGNFFKEPDYEYGEFASDTNSDIKFQNLQTAKYMFAFYAGRMYGKAGKSFLKKASEFFKKAEENAPSEKDFDNALWYRLDLERKKSFDSFLTELTKSVNLWHNSYWFEDLISQSIVKLVSAKDFKRLKILASVVKDTDLAEIQSAIFYILARSGFLNPQEAAQAYKLAYEKDHNFLYYRVLSAEKLNVPLANPLYRKRVERKANPVYTSEQALDILHAYIKYGLYKRLYAETVNIYPRIQVHEAEEISKALAAQGMYADSIKVMAFAVNSQDSVFNENHLKLIYPRPWLSEVKKWAKEYGIPEYLLYALIRSESYFKPSVVSHAGAIGLSQLMPPTANDIAKKLKIKNYNLQSLTKPDLNIRFGAYYLSEMIRRCNGRIMPALFSYNAGITTVRRWQKKSAELPEDLFLETLPYAETRGYGKNVLAAAVVYGSLYYNKTYSDVINEIFTDF